MTFSLRREEQVDIDQLHQLIEHSPGKAAQALLAAAAQNVVEAQLLLGQILLDGRGIEQDPALARTWFGIAARQGSAMGHNMLGRCLEHGRGGQADLAAAAGHYRAAAAAGLDWGQYNLANLLATGRGVGQDHAAALHLYQQAAHAGHAKSMNLLGRYLEQGLACAADRHAAMHWYRLSAEAGDFRGQFSHAAILAEQGHMEQSLVWLQKALEQGNGNFLRAAVASLEQAEQPQIQAMAGAYRQRLEQVSRQATESLHSRV